MARARQLPESVQELIRWRWSQRPTLKSLADEYQVSQSCISDILNPNLRKRRRKKYQDENRNPEIQASAIPTVSRHLTRQGRGVGESRVW